MQIHLGHVQLGQRLPDLPGPQAGPPLQVGDEGGAERGQPAASKLRAGGGRPGIWPPVSVGGPGELAGGPSAARAAAHDVPLGGQQGEHPVGDVHRAAVTLVGGVPDLLPEPRLIPGEFRTGRGTARGQRPHRRLAHLLEPALRIFGDAGLPQLLGKPALHPHGDLVRAGGLDYRYQIGRHDEHRAPHAEHPHQRAFLVQGVLDGRFVDFPGAGPGGQVDRRRVGAVQADDVCNRRRGRPGPLRRRQVMPGRQPPPPLGHADRPDASCHVADPTLRAGTVRTGRRSTTRRAWRPTRYR